MSIIKITKERAEELLSFLDYERNLYEESCYSQLDEGHEEDTETYLKNFDDIIAIVKSNYYLNFKIN